MSLHEFRNPNKTSEDKRMIIPVFESLTRILDGKLFRIPDYQRHYSWKPEHRKDLFDDIKRLQEFLRNNPKSKRIHFMATVVCLKTGSEERVDANSFQYYDVVDGQQRLTTLIILLKSISIKLKEYKHKTHVDIDGMLVKDNNMLIILQNNHDSGEILRNYLKRGRHPSGEKLETQADKNLAEAITECEQFVDEYPSSVDVMNLLYLIQNHLWFVFQQTDDEGSVYTIFEVLNSRGLDVDWLDKCKSLLMGMLFEYGNPKPEDLEQHKKDLYKLWARIYRAIGLHNIQGHEIISFAATLLDKASQSGRPHSAEEALKFFKEDCTKNTDSKNVINSIFEKTEFLRDITINLSELSAEKKIEAVTEISQARLLAVSIKLIGTKLSENEKSKLLEQWERTTFKIYGFCGKDARDSVGSYVRLAKTIQRDSSKSFKELLALIAAIGKDDPIEKSVVAWGGKNDVYSKRKWQNQLRYFFYKYEEYLIADARRQGKQPQLDPIIWKEIWQENPNSSIEHIMPKNLQQDSTPDAPQDLRNDTDWRKYFTDNEHEELLNSLGNLCLLSPGKNSEAGNKCFSDKLGIYKGVKLELLAEINRLNVWDKIAIEDRKERLLEFAKEQWKDLDN